MNALMIVFVTIAMVVIIALSIKIENSMLPGGLILVTLLLLIYHTYVLNNIPAGFEEAISSTYLCIAMDFLWLLISFLAYLWVDVITAIKFNKKSYDDSMAWFWDKL